MKHLRHPAVMAGANNNHHHQSKPFPHRKSRWKSSSSAPSKTPNPDPKSHILLSPLQTLNPTTTKIQIYQRRRLKQPAQDAHASIFPIRPNWPVSWRTCSTDLTIGQVQDVFNRFDANGDGLISSTELAGVLKALGFDSSHDEITRLMDDLDTDRDGFI